MSLLLLFGESEPPAFVLAESTHIAASAATATTFQLTPPAGKTSSNFLAGKISDDTNPLPAIDLGADQYTELEWAIEATADAEIDADYEFRVTNAGTPLDSYSVTPTLLLQDDGAQNINAPSALASWASAAATVVATVTVAGAVAAASWTVPAQTVKITAAAPSAVASWVIPEATIQAGAVQAPAAIASWTVPAVTVVSPVTVAAPVAVANWVNPAPTVTSPVTVQASAAISQWQVPAAQLIAGAIQAPTAIATWVAPTPTVSAVITVVAPVTSGAWVVPTASVIPGAVTVSAPSTTAAWVVPEATASTIPTEPTEFLGVPAQDRWVVVDRVGRFASVPAQDREFTT